MENNRRTNYFNNLEDSFEIANNINEFNEFNSIEEACEYYKQEYLNYKSKYEYINHENKKLIKERNKLLFHIGILKSELKEGQKCGIINNNINNIQSNIKAKDNKKDNNNHNNKEENDNNFDIEKEIEKLNKNIYHKNDILNDSIFKTLKEETNEQNKILKDLNNEKNKNYEFEEKEKELLTIESMNFEEDEEEDQNDNEIIKYQSEKNIINKNSLFKKNIHKTIQPKKSHQNKAKIKDILEQKNIIINSILSINNGGNISNNITTPTEKQYDNENIIFDEDIIKKSLMCEFINYRKDGINMRKIINQKEENVNNVYILIKKWEFYSKILKKGIETFYKSIEIFNKNLLNTENDLIESPDLLGLVYLLQNSLNNVIEHCKSFMKTIDSLFILHLENYKKKFSQNIKIQRYNLSIKISELINLKRKFLSTKINSYNSSNFTSAKNNYYSKYKSIEVYKYKYINSLNKVLMMKQIELPQLISLLSFSLMAFFRQVYDVLKEIDAPIKDNLEKINVRILLKNKILEKMKNDQINFEEKLFNPIFIDKNLLEKEGFINIKENDNNSNFKRKYMKIHNGKLIYFKIKKTNVNEKEELLEIKRHLKNVENIDINEYFDLCNLLLSNVKKNEKKYEYPFCFEIVDASSKKNYILQADTEYETEEWISSIQNAISDSISNFQDNKEVNEKNSKKNSSNKSLGLKTEKKESNNNEIINTIINNNVCADCGVKNPTWLCINWLTIICINCSAIHRGLGTNISKVKGFRLDNISNDLIELLEILKQDEINKILEKNLPENEKPNSESQNNIKEKFIIEKYKNKKFLEKKENINKEDIVKEIVKAMDENNLLEVYKYIKENINDINEIFDINGEEFGFLHYCSGKGEIQMVKLLCALGADCNKEDTKGLKPIIYAKLNKKSEIIDYLSKKEKI